MLGLGHAVYLWRMERGLTQEALARRAGLPRPAISALERGRLEPTLRTIRRVAHGLGVRPGLLVDGEIPLRIRSHPITRASAKRIAARLLGGTARLTAYERRLIPMLRDHMRTRLRLAGIFVPGRGSMRRLRYHWLILKCLLTRDELIAIDRAMVWHEAKNRRKTSAHD